MKIGGGKKMDYEEEIWLQGYLSGFDEGYEAAMEMVNLNKKRIKMKVTT